VTNPRAYWLEQLLPLVSPVMDALAEGRLKNSLPIAQGQRPDRQPFAPMEAFCRSFCGLAPWLQAPELGSGERLDQERVAALVRQSLETAFAPESPDAFDFSLHRQCLVEASFLALGLSRCRKAVWDKLAPGLRRRILEGLHASLRHCPGQNNWLLFAASVEAFLLRSGETVETAWIESAFRHHESWYKGDGIYGDGAWFHWDYYNSFVIHPLLMEVPEWIPNHPVVAGLDRPALHRRAVRFAAIQERFIGPDGSYPPLGRSLSYRCGAFHHLALMAWRRELPEELAPSQVRCALSAVLEKTLQAPGTYDAQGWLTIGLRGSQPSLAEPYISTGSLYLASFCFLPLGLPPSAPFWSGPDALWTSRQAWSGIDLPADHALHDDRP
jgi:hypothetical protein